ncbi:MAG: ATP phosphoribosyltransferase regulatory subunit [Clostridia bacterium]|nr:ATP phosphoribosyltransferase regulatory subunit [Clostridia bacterium]
MNFDIQSLTDTEKITLSLRNLYASYGYRLYRMAKFEEYELYAENKDFLVSQNVITFTDAGGKLMALKPDVTLSIVKSRRDDTGVVDRLYYNENVFRRPKGSQNFKEIMQVGLECIGAVGDRETAEVVTLACKSLDMLGRDFIVDISNLDVVNTCIGLITDVPGERKEILKRIGEKNVHELSAYAESKGVAAELIGQLMELAGLYGAPEDVLPKALDAARRVGASEAYDSLAATVEALRESGYYRNLRIDFSVVGDVTYYNGITLRGFIDGIPECVLTGGRYDGLMERLGKQSKAIGFAVNIDSLERIRVPSAGC